MLQPFPLLLALALAQDVPAPQGVAPPADADVETAVETDVEAWRALVRPTDDELAWEEIPWIPSFAGGVRRAGEEGRPLLFWAMNGHPLGCT